MLVSMNFGDAGMRPKLDVGSLLDLVDQILRHRAGERIPSNQDHNALRVLGKVHGSLSGGIRAADDVDHFAFTGHCLGRAAAIVHARALELIYAGGLQTAPLYTGSN